MRVRYRYRMYPDAAQAEMLARTFGCARVVFNDALHLRDQLHEAGEKLPDTEIQTRVITLARKKSEREWLNEVASIPKPLNVRSWECPCGARHDRGVNAARNILAVGQTERLNAPGAPVSPASQAVA